MHPYVLESKERTNVIFLLLVFGGAGALLCHWLLGLLGVTDLPWYIETPSPLAIYGLAYAAFNRWIWKTGICRLTGLVKTPDLGGEWKGRICSFGSLGSERDIVLTIRQTWTAICISLQTDDSRSTSNIAAITDTGPGETTLIYTYLNEPRSSAVETMHIHRGTAWLEVKDGGKLLEGEYYTGRDRVTYGAIRVSRIS